MISSRIRGTQLKEGNNGKIRENYGLRYGSRPKGAKYFPQEDQHTRNEFSITGNNEPVMTGNIELKDNNTPRERDAVNGNSSSNCEIEENMVGLVASPCQLETDPAKQFGEESKRRHRVVLDTVILYLVLAFFGMVGSLARVVLQRLTAFEGASGGVLWANFAGCVLMGILVKSKVLFGGLLDENNHLRQRAYKLHGEIPLYIGLATGCCGSITSFSSFMLTLFELTTNQTGVDLAYPNKGYGVMAFLGYMIITMAVSGAGFSVGHHIALMLDLLLDYVELARAELLIELAVAFSAALGYIVIIVLTAVFPSWRYWTFVPLVCAVWSVC